MSACVAGGFSFLFGGGGGIFRRPFGEQGMARGRERSPPTNVVGFKSRRRRHVWAEFVIGSPGGVCLQFDQKSGRRRTTVNVLPPNSLFTYFIYLLFMVTDQDK